MLKLLSSWPLLLQKSTSHLDEFDLKCLSVAGKNKMIFIAEQRAVVVNRGFVPKS